MLHALHYNARVLLEDQTSEKIGIIVNQNKKPSIFSYDYKGKIIKHATIIQGIRSTKPADFFLHVEVSGGPSGRRHVPIHPAHCLLSPTGSRPASTFKVGEKVITHTKSWMFQNHALQILMGSALGDASVRTNANGRRGAIRFGHGAAQHQYAAWKHAFLKKASGPLRTNANRSVFFDVSTSSFGGLLNEWVRLPGVKPRRGGVSRQAHPDMIDMLTPLAYAVWYLDDGTFGGSFAKWGKGKASISSKATDAKSLSLLAQRLHALGGGAPKVCPRGLTFSSADTWLFHNLIAPYVPPCMDYKIHPILRHLCGQVIPSLQDIQYAHLPTQEEILSISIKPRTQGMHQFSLRLPTNLAYFVDGVAIPSS